MATQPHSEVLQNAVHNIPLKPPVEDAIVVTGPRQLAIQRAPEEVLAEAAKAAAALRDVIESNPNKVVINNKTFLTFEDWLTVARFYGVTVACRTTNYLEQGRVRGYEAHAEAILASTGQVIGAAQAMCMDDEDKWRNKLVFQLRSMAQTRAQAKALRSILAWVVRLAGYATTPAEEMDGQARSTPLSPNMQYTPMHPDRVRKLCFNLANAATREELLAHWQTAGNEAQKFNDRAALEAFRQAKDARKRELQ